MGFHGLAPPDRWGCFRRSVGVWLVLTLVLGTAVVPEAWAVDYYVDTGGNDSNDGSSGAPWKTLTFALGQVANGDVIHMAPGLYDTPGNGEAFPLALVDGVAILGNVADPSQVEIEVPGSDGYVFYNNDTPLSASTRLAGVTLRDDGSADTVLMWFGVGSATMSPQIDHDVFTGNSGDDEAISYDDINAMAGTFTPTIDSNDFENLYTGVWQYDLQNGPGQVFSPVITNNTFTANDYPISYSMSSDAEGTVGGLVQDNTFSGTTYEDIYVEFYPLYYGSGLVFNPTITANDMQSGASTNVVAYLYGYSYEGDATFAPVISNNTMDATDYNVEMSGYYDYIDGDYTVAPVISGNTMTGATSAAVSLYLTTFSVDSSAQRNVLAPTITNNTITANGGDGVVVDLSDWSYGQIEGTATIEGNTISGASYGIQWAMSYMYYGTGMDWSIVISNNTITSPTSDGISFSMESMSFSGTGAVFNLTIEGNTITDAGSYGINAYPAYSWYADNELTETVLIRGNTVTGSVGDGLWLYFSDQTSNTLDARITDNIITGNGSDGLDIESNDLGSNGIQVACNVFTGNGANGINQDDGNDPPVDYGGGNLSSPGDNVIMSNTGFDFYNNEVDPVMAENNWWGSTVPATIDANISDNEEATGGAVDFEPFLMSAPTVTVNAPLTDSVFNDVAPPGPSIGDTLLYTAVIDTSGCGDLAMTFTATVDPNTTVVPGSVTTTQGVVQADVPPTVDLGYLPAGTAATVTWRVVVNGGTSVQTQGTVTATKSGATLTDDPDVGGSADPTVTVLAAPAAGTVQFALAAVTVNEGDGTATLDVTRTGGSFGAITVNFATADGTAAAPGDYTATSGSLSWPDGNTTTQQIAVPIVDDSDIEASENFTVTLTDPVGATFVGTPATVTVTIVDNDGAAQPIPTLGQWGLMLFAGLLLLLGLGLLRRRSWAGTGLLVLLALSLAMPAAAADDAKRLSEEMYVATVGDLGLSGGKATLRLPDGPAMTVPQARLKIANGHVKRTRGEQYPELTAEQRHAEAIERRALRIKTARLASMEAATPVLVRVELDKRDGAVRSVKVWIFDTPEQARAELARKQSGKKHPRE